MNKKNKGYSSDNPFDLGGDPEDLFGIVPNGLIKYSQTIKKETNNKVIYRDNIVHQMLRNLNTSHNKNTLLIGEAGIGKRSIIDKFTSSIAKNKKIVNPKTLVYKLDIKDSLTIDIINRVKEFTSEPDNNAVLYYNISETLSETLDAQHINTYFTMLLVLSNNPFIRIIATITPQELKFVDGYTKDKIIRRFNIIKVPELSNKQTIQILKDHINQYQQSIDSISITDEQYSLITQTGNQCSQYLHLPRPASALKVLDMSIGTAKVSSKILNKKGGTKNVPETSQLSNRDILSVSKQIQNDCLTDLNDNTLNITPQRVKKIATDLDQNIIGQARAKQKILKAIKSIGMKVFPQTKPYSFLFSGPSGTGKTEIAKQLANALFGSTNQYIYLNMTEYAEGYTISSLLGSPRGYVGYNSPDPLPLDRLKTNPNQIILLDEFEKCSYVIKKVFMQALSEGFLTYRDGTKIDFSHSIVIATTNAGTKKISTKKIGFNNKSVNNYDHDVIKTLTNAFPIELLNRFSYIVNFAAISKPEYEQILAMKYNKMIKIIKQTKPELVFHPQVATTDLSFITKLARQSYSRLFNGRPAQRTMQGFLERLINDHPDQHVFNLK